VPLINHDYHEQLVVALVLVIIAILTFLCLWGIASWIWPPT